MNYIATERFIEKARKIHGDRYDYSKVDYVNNHTKVCIICPIHGEFWQIPSNHIHNTHPRGCSKCNGGVPLTMDEFLKRANEAHGEKYDYSKVDLDCRDEKGRVCIICPEHGEFWQTPHSHLRGSRCPQCWEKLKSRTLLSTTEKFIEKARKIHGEKYDYSKVVYKRSNEDVCIICPEHGEFWQTPNKHLSGEGCKECSKIISSEKRKSTTEEFIERAREVHGDKYDYSKVEYIDANSKVCIICLEHGEFWQTPHNHLNGKGCKECGIEKRINDKFVKQNENIIKRFIDKHGNKYEYDKVKYKKMTEKVIITCPKHGDFLCTPVNHLKGRGCPKCKMSHSECNVEKALINNGINYKYNVKNKTLSWLRELSLDFYLPDYNVAIECQGGQHFYSVEYFGGEDKLKKQLERDRKKKLLCEKHNINLLYYSEEKITFPYYVNTSIEELINKIKAKIS